MHARNASVNSTRSTHSFTFPCMSCRPQAFAANDPAGAVSSPSQRLPQPSQFARLRPMSCPHEYRVVDPARAAYSHSDSLGNL